MRPDLVINPGPLALQSEALPTVQRGSAKCIFRPIIRTVSSSFSLKKKENYLRIILNTSSFSGTLICLPLILLYGQFEELQRNWAKWNW